MKGGGGMRDRGWNMDIGMASMGIGREIEGVLYETTSTR